MKKLLAVLLLAISATSAFAEKKGDWLDRVLEVRHELAAISKAHNFPWESKVYHGMDAPGHVEMDVKGLDRLTLTMWETPDGINYDLGVWADAKFIASDGSETWLSDMPFIRKLATYGSIFMKKNSAGKNFSIADKEYEDGVLNHALGLLVVDLSKKNYVKFVSDIGIDNFATQKSASVIFKISYSTGLEEAVALTKEYAEIKTEFVPYIGGELSAWLISQGTQLEQNNVRHLFGTLGLKDNSEIEKEIARIESLPSEKEKVLAYLKYNKYLRNLQNIRQQFDLINTESILAAYADFSKTKGYDKTLWQAKVDELLVRSKKKIETISDIKDAVNTIKLARQILLSNPAVIDSIVVTRFHISGSEAHQVMGPRLGTQANNWSCQLSAARSGFDADLLELSGIRSDNIKERIIYEAPDGDVITDATLHWDGNRIMFTSTDSLKRFQVYEVKTDGSGFRQVTHAEDEDLEFFDAQYLPSGKIVACTNMGYHGVPCVSGSDAVGNYALYDPATHKLRRLTFDQDNNWNATVLQNGKVMYTRWEYTDLTHYYSRIVFTMNPDGTEQRALFGSGSMFPNSTFDMQQLPENTNRFIGVISGHHGVPRSGRLIIFDPTKNRAGAAGMVQEIPHSKRPIETLVKDQLVDDVWPQFLKPHPLNDHYFLVAAKLSPESLWGIYLVDIYDNMLLIKEGECEGYINSIPLRARKMPVNIPERIPMDLTTADHEATMFIQDIYEGEGLKNVPRGTVKKLRIYAFEYDYLHTMSDHIWNGIQSGWDIKRLLGYVDVEKDGSAIFKVPANTPISIQPVDSLGRAVQWMRSWTLGMPGEIVSCVGCHENQNQIAMPKRTIASTIKPHSIEPVLGAPRAINFEQDIQPILSRACVACHNGERHAGGIDYTANRPDTMWYGSNNPIPFSKSYFNFHPYFYRQGPETEMQVLNPYEYSAYNSEMLRMLKAGHHGVQLTDEEFRRIYMWLDMNVPYHNTALANPHVTPTGDTIDQKVRRRELGNKYSINVPDWEKEIADYQRYLESLPAPVPVMPETPAVEKVKEIKVKGFPFGVEEARAMQGENCRKTVELAPGVEVEFVKIPAGTYIMGDGRAMSAERRKVRIDKPFWMSTTELTNQQLRTMVPDHDSRCIGQHWKDHTRPGYPVNADTLAATKVSFDEAMQFCSLLSQKTGLNVTIPTEEQWEWAARAGSDQDFWFGNVNADYGEYENMGDSQLSKMAVSGVDPQPMSPDATIYRWCAYIPRDKDVDDHNMLLTSPGRYKANPWGLYDMNGNVAEWTRSVYYPDKSNTTTIEYVVCGGSWYDRAKRSTCASRRSFLPWIKVWNTGIRLVIED